MFKIYNTLTRKKEVVKAIHGNDIGMYTCGPTVYDYAHIGNLRAYVFADLLKRWLICKGFHVKHVMNITDVGHLVSDADEGEDKMELGAKREHKTAWQVAEMYTDAFMEDIRKLNIIIPDVICKATDYIPEMIALVQRLEKKGLTYIIEDGVYFDTSKLKDYGKLARLDIEGLKAGARIEVVEGKRNSTDFALWKFSPKDKERDMEWDSPWGRGFPGWHIECSAMAMKYLGEHFDIHTGGVDHVNVHHTNEIAQSEAATGKNFVNYWMHLEHLLVNGQKISKSLKNFILVKELEAKGYAPVLLRYFLLSGHYKSQINFSYEALDQARETLDAIEDFISKVLFVMDRSDSRGVAIDIDKYRNLFEQAMDDDLNVSNALACLQYMIADINKAIDKREADKKSLQKAFDFIKFFNNAFGVVDFDAVDRMQHISNSDMEMIDKREQLRAEKRYKEADEIRSLLKKNGIDIEDTPYGTRWICRK